MYFYFLVALLIVQVVNLDRNRAYVNKEQVGKVLAFLCKSRTGFLKIIIPFIKTYLIGIDQSRGIFEIQNMKMFTKCKQHRHMASSDIYQNEIEQGLLLNIYLIVSHKLHIKIYIELLTKPFTNYNNFTLIQKALQFFTLLNMQQAHTDSLHQDFLEDSQNQNQIKNSLMPQLFTTIRTSIYVKETFPSIVLIAIMILALPVNNSCIIAANQSVYVSATGYCQIQYCSFASVSICYYYECQITNVNGTDVVKGCSQSFYSTSDVTCDITCCKDINNSQNSNNSFSKRYCSAQHSSASNVQLQYNTIAIIVFAIFGGILLIIIIIICYNRLSRNRANNAHSHHGVTVSEAIAPSQINLEDYKLDEEGPYLINIYNQCAICLDPNVNLRTHCNHYYHGVCLFQWFRKNPGNPCPLCMSLSYNPVKVYCKQCYAGDQLIIFSGSIPRTQIQAIDSHKCQGCKNNQNQQVLTFYDQDEIQYKSKNDNESFSKKTQIANKPNKAKQEQVIDQQYLSKSNKKLHQDDL